MKKFKIVFILMLMFTFAFAMVGCQDPDEPVDPVGPVDPDDPDDPDESTYDFMGADFVIMVDTVSTTDPREGNYQKLFQEEKKALIEAVEEKYNLNVVYKAYPSEASWGGARERYLIQNTAANTPVAHVYEMPSYSVGTLATNNAISPLDSYIELYGNDTMWEESKKFGTVLGQVYGYTDQYPIADEGIFYNIDLLEEYLGEGNGDLPSQLWLDGEWTWAKYEEICKQLDSSLPDDYYVMGGTAYNWSYQMLGANGVHVVNSDLKCELATTAGIETMTYLNKLYTEIRWDTDPLSLSNATSQYMVQGKVAFHNGQSYWIFQANKWLDKNFKIGYVPYPVGTNVKDTTNLTDYYINDVYGKTQYCISSAYSKANVKPGYEDSTLTDELIFKIWSELQYFPEADETGYASSQDYIDEYEIKRLGKYYGSESSVEAHLSVIKKGYPDYFYSLDDAKGQTDSSYMVQIQGAVKGEADNIRSAMENIKAQVEASFKALYGLSDDYYD